MPRRVLVHAAVWNTIPRHLHSSLRSRLRSLKEDDGTAHAHLKRVHGTGTPAAVRLRFGRYRIMGEFLPANGALLLTTAFRKKRDVDYARAFARHADRVARVIASDAAAQEGDRTHEHDPDE